MNVFNFLKGTSGKVVFGATQLAGTVLVGGLLGISAWNVANPPQPKENMPIRSFSQIAKGETQYDGMSISAGDVQFATAEERAKIEGSSNDFGLENEKNLEGISLSKESGASGGAYQLGESEGLGMGANDAVQVGAVARGAGADAASGVNLGGLSGAAAQSVGRNGATTAQGAKQLQTASIARASGGNSGGSFSGSASGSSSVGNRVSGRQSDGASQADFKVPGAAISGAMPEGSSLITAGKFDRGHSDALGGSRAGHASSGTQSKDGRDLAFIAKRSADAAKNKNRSANEGSRAFLASTKNSGGIDLDNGEQIGTSAQSEDFNAPMLNKEKNLKNNLDHDDTWKKEAEKAERRQKLKSQLIMLMFASIPAIFAIATLWDAGNGVFGWLRVAALAIAAAMTAWWAVYIANAFKYKADYGDGSWAWASLGAGAAFVTLIWGSMFVKGIKKVVNKVINKVNNLFGTNVLNMGSAATIGLTTVEQGVRGSVDGAKDLGKADESTLDLDENKK